MDLRFHAAARLLCPRALTVSLTVDFDGQSSMLSDFHELPGRMASRGFSILARGLASGWQRDFDGRDQGLLQ